VKKVTILISVFLLFAELVFAQDAEKKEDPNKLFYVGNNFYEKRDYKKAIEEYLKILDMGLKSGHLYYNIGNAFFKTGRLGHAILYYERARRIIPQDRDLRANLAYAKSLVESSGFDAPAAKIIPRLIKKPFADLSLNALATLTVIVYFIMVAMLALLILNPFFAKKFWPVFIMIPGIFLMNLSALAIRYYDEDILKRGVIVQKEADCKYEPIDKSTTYYRLQEGDEVIVLSTRAGWRQIKRLDGRIAWVREEGLEEI